MYSNLPEGAADNPFAPYNVDERCLRFDVFCRHRRINGSSIERWVTSFDDIETAVAFVGNTETHYGPDLWINEVDVRTDDTVCVLAGEFCEDLGRYLNQ